jgi:hypothetical protein
MGIFSTILEKLGLKKDTAAAPAAPTAAAKPMTAAPAATATAAAPVAQPKPAAFDPLSSLSAQKPTAVSEVDVVKQLEKLSAGSNLDWKVSIVDLLKLLNIDSSREARNELAKELNCPADLMSDSAKMNVWLHKTVLQKIAENGGNVPSSLYS